MPVVDETKTNINYRLGMSTEMLFKTKGRCRMNSEIEALTLNS